MKRRRPHNEGRVKKRVAGIYAWNYVSDGISPALRLGGSIVIGTMVYVGFLWMTKRELFYEIRELVGRK